MPGAKNSYPFKLGGFECLVVKDGPLIGPDNRAARSAGPKISRGVKIMDVSCLLIKTPAHLVLIDTGFGPGARPVIGGIPQNVGHLLPIMQKAGISPLEIDTLILSHAHPDHIGGLVDRNGQPVFPHARHFIPRREWDFWWSNPDLSMVEDNFKQAVLAAIAKNLLPLRDRFELVVDGTGIVPGIQLVSTPGHTPGHSSLIVTSGTQSMVCICDVLHWPREITHPDLASSSDMSLPRANISRHAILSRIVQSGALVFACHFPFPGLGYVLTDGREYLWQPYR
jgi:glyoxylase-like metal-dependent hydrolase (beta-lactamase superfamily II)